ncbi:MAG: ATP-binding cassette domain-containing protein [Lachnospiraceae bacterium]|nr:ATP-binding cassette domain-containing protein [Lachnospiraceae bacterium]
MSECILAVKNVTKRFSGHVVIDNVSLSINKGDIYGLIGANGAGKSTLMKIICGLVRQNSGSYELFGESKGKKLFEARSKVGVLIEAPAMYGELTAMQNLEVQYRYLYGRKADERYLKELLALVGLEDTGKKIVMKFSLGMKQRLGLAVALIGEPEFLILDEPYNGLDPIGVVEIRDTLEKLNKEKNVTILISCHNLDQMAILATRYGFIHKGKLMKEITAEQLNRECKNREINLEAYYVQLHAMWRD